MAFVLSTVLVGLLLFANLVVHDFSCWGLQPGGKLTALLFGSQSAISLMALTWMTRQVFQGKFGGRFAVFALALALTIAAIATFATTGWRMYSSIHSQGPENLTTFALASAVALVVGMHWIELRDSQKI